jgi:hypothetical protein
MYSNKGQLHRCFLVLWLKIEKSCGTRTVMIIVTPIITMPPILKASKGTPKGRVSRTKKIN